MTAQRAVRASEQLVRFDWVDDPDAEPATCPCPHCGADCKALRIEPDRSASYMREIYRALKARGLLASFPSREDGLGSLKFALANILEIVGDERRRGFKSQVSGNWETIRQTCIEIGANSGYVASRPDGRSTEHLRSKLGKLVYSERHSGDQIGFFLAVANAPDTEENRATVLAMRDRLDPGSIGIDHALEILAEIGS